LIQKSHWESTTTTKCQNIFYYPHHPPVIIRHHHIYLQTKPVTSRHLLKHTASLYSLPFSLALSHCLTGCIIIRPPVLRHEANYSNRDRVLCTFRDSQRATVHEVWGGGWQVLCARWERTVPGAAAVSDGFEAKVHRLRLLLCAEGRLQG
jgi:hypothetical protein